MSVYRCSYAVEVTTDEKPRLVEADAFAEIDGWLVFSRFPPEGGRAKEHCRIRIDAVVSMGTLYN